MLKEVFRLLPKITVIWLVMFILAGVFGIYLDQPFDFVSPLIIGLLWLLGGALALGLVASLFDAEGRIRRVVCLLLIGTAFPTFYFYGYDISFYSYFYWHKSQYEAVIASLSSSTQCPPPIHSDETNPRFDCDSPRRVAFPMPGGIIDNWVGIVYDPTGLVTQVNQVSGSGLKNPKFAYVVGLFGGDMASARHLFGHWYVCSFT